jgi:hypothetical protein
MLPPNRKIILSDVDECLARTTEAALREAELWYMLPIHSLKLEDVTEYSMEKPIQAAMAVLGVERSIEEVQAFLHARCWDSGAFYLYLKSYTQHLMILRNNLSIGGKVHLLTARPKSVLDATERWLGRVGLADRTSLHMEVRAPEERAALVDGLGPEVIYDDNPANLVPLIGRPGIELVVPTRPWNADAPAGMTRKEIQ